MRNVFPSILWSIAGHEALFELVRHPFINLWARPEDRVKKRYARWLDLKRPPSLDTSTMFIYMIECTKAVDNDERIREAYMSTGKTIRCKYSGYLSVDTEYLVHCKTQGYCYKMTLQTLIAEMKGELVC